MPQDNISMKVLPLAPSTLISSHKEHTPDLSLSPSYSTMSSSGESILSSVEQSSSSEENNLRHFQKGSLIQLSSGQTKKVEDLETEDFICSARSNPDITLDHSTLDILDSDYSILRKEAAELSPTSLREM